MKWFVCAISIEDSIDVLSPDQIRDRLNSKIGGVFFVVAKDSSNETELYWEFDKVKLSLFDLIMECRRKEDKCA